MKYTPSQTFTEIYLTTNQLQITNALTTALKC